ncbi:MAG: AI-2E family transporter, partial [Pirellulaceae bacterium]
WVLRRVGQRPKLAASLSTAAILIIVLLPFTLVVIIAAAEGRHVIRKLDPNTIDDRITALRGKLHLEMPAAMQFDRIDKVVGAIKSQTLPPNLEQQRSQVEYDIAELRGLAVELGSSPDVNLQWTDGPAAAPEAAGPTGAVQSKWQNFALELNASRAMLSDEQWSQLEGIDARQQQLMQAREQFNVAIDRFYAFKTQILGGPIRSWVTELANPNPEELGNYIQKGTAWMQGKLVSLGSATTGFLFRFLFGTAIMAFALFSFLLDGPGMVKALKGLTPLNDDYEDELIEEFDRVSRAVVVATLLSAIVQGILAAVGYYFAGLESVFLLMLLTTVMALVPFFGAASVWLPASLFIVFVEGRVGAGIGLAIYGAAVVSMADNVIKPLVLHGQSNLHPLWALLSVLGGVTALGPVGILVGPMIVAFLQTLLKILQRELTEMDEHAAAARSSPGGGEKDEAAAIEDGKPDAGGRDSKPDPAEQKTT